MNINEIGAKTCHCCEGEAPMSMDSRTIKDNIRETTEQLHIIEGMARMRIYLERRKNMAGIGTIVSIRRSDEYGGKYAGKLGIVKKLADNRVGVEFSDLKNPASGYGLFWFKKENVKPSFFDTPKHNDAIIPAALAKAFLNFTFGAPRASLGVKQVIFSGPKTIVFWLDGTKTIVSCGEGDNNDPYAGFCAAVTKRVFGSTSQAKKVLARTRKETSK